MVNKILMAEQCLLGALMVSPDLIDKAAKRLAGKTFSTREHDLIYKTIKELATEGKPCDFMVVCDRLGDKLGEAGGWAYIVEIQKSAFSTANTDSYADIVAKGSTARRIESIGDEIKSIGRQALLNHDDAGALAQVESLVTSLTEGHSEERSFSLNQALKTYLSDFEQRLERGGDIVGTATGFMAIDARMKGLRAGELIILAARPGMGKTSLAVNIAEYASANAPVIIFSAEMGANELTERIITSVARIDYSRVQAAQMEPDDYTKFSSAFHRLTNNRKLQIDETASPHIDDIRMKARRYKREQGGLGLVVVDYLQLCRADGKSRYEIVTNVSQGLKALAKELNCPVMALSQMSRDIEKGGKRAPTPADLRESGQIEQDADVIWFIHNPAEIEEDDTGIRELHTAKFRRGVCGRDSLDFIGYQCRFADTTRIYEKQKQSKGSIYAI
jgi:replicative DNA helicase